MSNVSDACDAFDVVASGYADGIVPDFSDGSILHQPVPPNPDIAGLGVLIGLSAPGYIALVLVTVYYICGYGLAEDYNMLDCLIVYRIHQLKRKLWSSLRATDRGEVMLRKSILMLSDQQAVTGIAILVAAFLQLDHGISSYHWQIVVNSAWFASVTHLSTLTFLKPLFRQKAALRVWRLVLMSATALMLAVAFLPTGDIWWRDAAGIPAKCYFKWIGDPSRLNPRSNQFYSLLVSMVILCFGYSSRAIQLSFARSPWSRLRSGLERYISLHKILRNLYSRIHGPLRSFPWIFLYTSLHTILILTKASYVLYGSLMWEIHWLAFALTFGSLHLYLGPMGPSDASSFSAVILTGDNVWGFGQCIAVVLLFLPLQTLLAEYHGHRSSNPINSHEINTSEFERDVLKDSIPAPPLPKIRLGKWQPPSSNIPQNSNPIPLDLTRENLPRYRGDYVESSNVPTLDSQFIRLDAPRTSNISNSATAITQPVDLDQLTQLSGPPVHQKDLFAFDWFHHTIAFVAVFTWSSLLYSLYTLYVSPYSTSLYDEWVLLAIGIANKFIILIAWTASCSVATLLSYKGWCPLCWMRRQLQSLKGCFRVGRILPQLLRKRTEKMRLRIPNRTKKAALAWMSNVGNFAVTALAPIMWWLWSFGLMAFGVLQLWIDYPLLLYNIPDTI